MSSQWKKNKNIFKKSLKRFDAPKQSHHLGERHVDSQSPVESSIKETNASDSNVCQKTNCICKKCEKRTKQNQEKKMIFHKLGKQIKRLETHTNLDKFHK